MSDTAGQGKTIFVKRLQNMVRKFFGTYAIIVAILILGIILTFVSDNFLTVTNLVNILRQVSMVAIMSVGAYFVIVSGGLDASMGAIVGVCSVVCATLLVKLSMPPVLAVICALAAGALAGLINGLTITRLNIPPLIATIGLKMILVGVAYIICQGYTISGIPDAIVTIGRGYAFHLDWLPIPVAIMIVIALLSDFVSQRTKFGRYIYAVGGNAEAAHLSGIKYKNVQMWAYIIAGLSAAIAGIIVTGRLASGDANAGDGWEFDAIIACVIGGVSTTGGRGRVFGAIFGTIMIGLLNNGMTLLNIDSYYQQVVSGLVLMAAIAFDIYNVSHKKKAIDKKLF